MKKLLTLFAFAVGGILCVNAGSKISGTDFDSFALDTDDEGNPIPTTVINRDDSGIKSDFQGYAGSYWYSEYSGVANVMKGLKTGEETQYLFINTSGETLVRNINLDGSAQDLTEITDGKLFFDSKVQFTATESLSQQAVIGGTDKLIVWLKEESIAAENLVEGGPTTTTNLVVTAAQITSTTEGSPVDYVITKFVNKDGTEVTGFEFEPGAWYRLTIVAYPNAFNGMDNAPAFAVYVNEKRAVCEETAAIVEGAGVTVEGTYQWLDNGIFPSLQLGVGTAAQTIKSVAFEGYGYVDDLEFTTEALDFALPPAGLTINWGEGIASITVKKNGSEDVVITPGQGEYAAAGTMKFDAGVYTISATLVEGYFNDSLQTGEFDATSANVVPPKFTAQKIYCKIGDTNYASLEDALAYINGTNTEVPEGTKIVLYNDVSIASDGDQLTISKDIILDLAGKKITSAAGVVLEVSANVTIITSAEGGAIINNFAGQESSAVCANEGAVVTIGANDGDCGVMITGWAFDGNGTIKLVRAIVEDKDGNNGVSSYCDENSEITGTTTINDLVYSVVAPKSTEAPTTYIVTFEDGVADAEIAVPEAQPVNSGAKATEPTAPTRDGYTFAGWFLKTGDTVADTVYDFDTAVTGNITLVAKWEAITFEVTFDDGIDNTDNVVDTVKSGATATEPTAPTRDGYTFAGWFLKTGDTVADTVYDFDTAVTGNITLVAKWEAVVGPSIGDSTVAPDKVFDAENAQKPNSQTPIVYPSEPTLTTADDGTQTITFGGKTVNVPEYYTATLNDKTVSLTLNENAIPVIGGTEAGANQDAIPAFKTEAGKVTIGVAKTIEGLYYGIAVATSLGNNPTFAPVEATLVEGDGQALALTITKDANEKVKFFKVYVTDIAPTK